MPGVGEVQDVGGLLDDPDHVRPVLQRIHERRDVAAAQQVGDPLQVVEAQVLLGQEDHQVLRQRPAQAFELVARRHLREVQPGDGGAQGAGHRLDRER